MKAIYKINKDTGLAEIKAGDFELEVSEDGKIVFNNTPVTIYVYMGISKGELYVSTTTAELKGESIDEYISELTQVRDAYKAIIALLDPTGSLSALGASDSKKKKDSKTAKRPAWMKK